jgi:hypothetical protein
MGETAFIHATRVGRLVRRNAVRIAAAAVLAGAFAGSAGAVACADGAERNSLSVRTLQTRLMVAALTCDARGDYNAFVRRFRPQLAGYGGMLRSYFRKAYGAGSTHELNAYVTDLANRTSALSAVDRPAFCRASREAFDMLLSAPAQSLRESLIQAATMPAPARDALPACDALTRR